MLYKVEDIGVIFENNILFGGFLNFQSAILNFFITFCAGFTGGSYYTHKGAAVEPLCLPRNPEWGRYTDGYDGAKAYVFGAEYESYSFKGFDQTIHEHDVPCAVCLVRQRTVVMMFPGEYGKWKERCMLHVYAASIYVYSQYFCFMS